MSLTWSTPAGNLGIVPELEYYSFQLSATDDAGGTLVYNQISGQLPPGLQVVMATGYLQGVPINNVTLDNNVTYTFTVRVTNTSTGKVSDRTFNLTITNVAPPIIVPKNIDLGSFLDGTVINILTINYPALQLDAFEFIPGATITWSVKSGSLPDGLSLSSTGVIYGYLKPIAQVGPSSETGWDESAWDELGWQFPLGTTSKEFTFTIEASDGVNSDLSTYTMLVLPTAALTADSNTYTVDSNLVNINTEPLHNPIILTQQSDIVPERQGGYFSFQIQAIDLDGDTLQYEIPSVSSGAYDEETSPLGIPFINEIVTDGNLYVGTTSIANPNVPFLANGAQVQVLYTDPSTDETFWHTATVNQYTKVRLTGNGIVTGTVGTYLTQGFANAQISTISNTTGTILFAGNLITATAGSYITQGSANAIVTTSAANLSLISLQYLAGSFSTTGGNVSINGTMVNSYPYTIIAQTDIGAVYQNSYTFVLNSTTANIAGSSTGAVLTSILSAGVAIGSLIDHGEFGYDDTKYDQGALTLPLILPNGFSSIIDINSGWITGYLPSQTSAQSSYNFELAVYKKDYPLNCTADNAQYKSTRLFTITVLGDLDNTVTWLTPSNLGTIENGKVSDLFVKAISSKNKTLYYTYTPGSNSNSANFDGSFSGAYSPGSQIRLPQGLTLTSSGLISGRVSFEVFSLDQGTTTIDGRATTFDDTYTFSVTASDFDNTISATQTFTIQVVERNTSPYENLYLKALLSQSQRDTFQSLMQDQSMFPLDMLYRVEDPYYGVARDIRALFLAGLQPSALAEYAAAVEVNHYTKRLTFGPIQTAIARDSSYDVIQLSDGQVIGTFQDTIGFIPTDFSLGYVPSSTIPTGTQLSNEHIKYEVVYAEIIDQNTNALGQSPANSFTLSTANPYYDANNVAYVTGYPNAFGNMDNAIVSVVGYANKGALPDWMTTLQRDSSVLGFKRAVVLAYTKPGASEALAWRFQQQGFDLNTFDFTVDRYDLDNIYSANYQILKEVSLTTAQKILIGGQYITYPINTVVGTWDYTTFVPNNIGINIGYLTANAIPSGNTQVISTSNVGGFIPSQETTFDRYPGRSDQYPYSGTIDYAVSIPFESINGRSVTSINEVADANGILGLDGVTTYTSGQLLVFFKQEYQTGIEISNIYNQGWANISATWGGSSTQDEWDYDSTEGWDAASYVPGFLENQQFSVINQRAGVWQINIDDDNIVTLTYVMDFPVTSTVYDPIVGRYVQTSTTISSAVPNLKLFVRNGVTHGGINIFYDTKPKPGNLYPSYSDIPQQINTTVLSFDQNGTRFLNNRDSYTVPEAGDKYIKFAKTGVFT